MATPPRTGRHLVMALSGPYPTEEERVFLEETSPAGVILFSRNLVNLEQIGELIRTVRESCREEVTIWADQEGGRVQRIKAPLTIHPPAIRFADLHLRDPERAIRLARMAGHLCGMELAALGIGVDCAPVLDLLEEGADPVIGDRAFGRTPEQVVHLAGAWLAGLGEAGVMGMGKHFPGHGAARVDSHLALPVVEKEALALGQWELEPFRRLLKHLPGLMTAHLVATGLDPEQPATLSPRILKGLLRERWGYLGLVISDALEMKALDGDLRQRAMLAMLAGCDLVLCCTGRLEDTRQVLEGITAVMDRDPQGFAESRERIRRILMPHRPEAVGFEVLRQNSEYLALREKVESLAVSVAGMDVTEQLMG